MVLTRDLAIAEGELLLVDKPKGWTSFDVVNKIRRLFRVKRIGHAGTLDPMATGLLLICSGRKTKELSQYAGLEKEYEAEMVLGARTSSFDAETPVIEQHSTDDVTGEQIRSVMEATVGFQTQLPPMWSAAKVAGKRLYTYARKGEVVERRPREICVRSLVPTRISMPVVQFTVVCSKGTYVRGLVDDMGSKLGCGAYLSGLKRTRIGEYRLENATTVDELIAYSSPHHNRSL